MSYCVYILRSETTDQYYVGHTNDLDDRLRRHNEGRVDATRSRGPWQVNYSKQFSTRKGATAHEREIKSQKSRGYIEALCGSRQVG